MKADSPRRARQTIVTAAKIALALAILAFLVVQVQRHEGFSRLIEQPKQWGLIATGLASIFISTALSFLRWHLLIRALDLPVRLVDSMWLGSLGFALNFVSLGSVGGDLFKAAFLAHRQPGRRTLAVASVIADRVVGLLTHLTIASGGILAANLLERSSADLIFFCRVILIATAIGWGGLILLFAAPRLSGPGASALVGAIPLVGDTFARLLGALRAYRDHKGLLLAAGAVSGVGALFYISSYYLVASGLPLEEPSWVEHLVVVPVASLAGAIPATPNGLGTQELALELLYRAIPSSGVLEGDGTMVALAQRLTMMAVALIGLIFYLTHRAELRQVYEEAEAAAESESI